MLEKLFVNPGTRAVMFKNVCLGGTFDGIHPGHEQLFWWATKLCKERLVVGVTDTNMTRNKILWELIAPVDERIENVRRYLKENAQGKELIYDIVSISDIYGPAIVREDLECIVVSQETIGGAEKINAARIEKGWQKLKIHPVNLLEDTNPDHKDALYQLKEKKFSSSCSRANKLGSILKQPTPNDSIPKRPYLIGLTGGIASGKTSIGEYLKSLGFGYISYDSLGHKTYAQLQSPTYKKIVEHFGDSILDQQTNHIDRSKLGRVVFNDKEKLEKLNAIVWPAIYTLVDEEIDRLKKDHEVIILESALLIESGQTDRVHQVWTTIIPPEEAIKRQVNNRGLSREEAEKRVNAQVDNLTRIRKSNAVFCSIWEPEFTRQQVQKCIKELRDKYL